MRIFNIQIDIDRLIGIRRQILEKRYTIHRIRGTLSSEETVLDYKEEDDDILKRLWELNDNYQALDRTRCGSDCNVVLVFNPDILSLRESQRLIEGLDDLCLPLRLLVDNKVTEENEEIGEEAKKQKGRAASAHTTKGLILEKWCPFLNHPEIEESWEAKNWVFMGQPIDYIVFDWDEDSDKNRTDGRIVMLDVKSGKSQLTTKQRRIRDLVKAGKVEWREIRLE